MVFQKFLSKWLNALLKSTGHFVINVWWWCSVIQKSLLSGVILLKYLSFTISCILTLMLCLADKWDLRFLSTIIWCIHLRAFLSQLPEPAGALPLQGLWGMDGKQMQRPLELTATSATPYLSRAFWAMPSVNKNKCTPPGSLSMQSLRAK